jgi:hypothetical protein
MARPMEVAFFLFGMDHSPFFPYLHRNNKTFYFALNNLPFTAEIDEKRLMKLYFFFGIFSSCRGIKKPPFVSKRGRIRDWFSRLWSLLHFLN